MNRDVNSDEAHDESHGGYESPAFSSHTPAHPTSRAALERSFHNIGRFLVPPNGVPTLQSSENTNPAHRDEGPCRSEGITQTEDEPLGFLSSNECEVFIACGSGIDLAVVAVVMGFQFEFMHWFGLIVGPEPPWVYFAKDELVGEPPVVDTLRLAREVEKRAGVPEDVAHVVFEWELKFLEQEGFA